MQHWRQSVRLTNLTNINYPLAVWLASNDYDLEPEKEKTISATTLLKSIRQIILSDRASKEALLLGDISSLVPVQIGTAVHSAIEKALKDPERACKALGIKVPQVSIAQEQRATKEFMGWKVTGKFDLVIDGQVQDFKTTSMWTYIKQNNADKYVLQGSIYRWLNPDLITDDVMFIHYIFTDNVNRPDAPETRVLSQPFVLKSKEETESYIRRKLTLLDKYWDKEEAELPYCTDEELWREEPKWKVYSSNDSKRALKVFDTLAEANSFVLEKGKGIVKEVKGQARACNYCPAFAICSQKDFLVERGEL